MAQPVILATNTLQAEPDEAAATETPEGTAAPVDETPVPRELVEWMQQMSMTQWGVTVVVFILMGGGAMVGLYRSASPTTQQLIRTGLTAGVGAISDEAKRRQQIALLNDIDWDDPIWAGIVAGSDKLKMLVKRLSPATYSLLPDDDDARG